MSDYRFVTSDTVTGRVLSDSLPIVGQSCNRQLNSVGQFTGALSLAQDVSPTQLAAWVASVTPWKSILWVLQDGQPIWHGPIIGWPHTSLSGGTLPISAASFEEFFKHRQITDNLTFANMDVYEIFRQELLYAVHKQPNGNIAGTGQYANNVGIVDTVLHSGIVGSITEQASLKFVYDAWGDLVTLYQLEFALTPAITDSGSLFTQVQLGLPQLGRPYTQTGFQLIIPSYHMQDYGWQWVPSSPVNSMVVTGSGATASFISKAQAKFELDQGFPLLEGNTSFSGTVKDQAQLDAFAKGTLYPTTVLGFRTPTVLAGAGATLRIRDAGLGDEVMFAGTSDLHPAGPNGQPGEIDKFQIVGWTLNFPNGTQSEQTVWQLGPPLTGVLV
jgi:hypothetical protein